ncbi:hypothetical protein ACHAWF_000738, partial [Thalassiosira exigua]
EDDEAKEGEPANNGADLRSEEGDREAAGGG